MTALPPPVLALARRLGVAEGDLGGADRARAEEALDDAAAVALAEVPAAVAERWAADAPPVVVTVVLKAARREFENPQGLRSENLGEHGFSVATATGVYLTSHEVTLLRRAASPRPAVGSVRTPSAYH